MKVKPEDKSSDELVEKTIEEFFAKMFALSTLTKIQLKHARENQESELAKQSRQNADALAKLKRGALNASEAAFGVNKYLDSKKALEILRSFPHEAMMAETIFTSIFSILDAFLNVLLHHLYARNPSRVNQSEEKTVDVSDVLNRTKEEIVNSLIDKEVESLLRESYVKNFAKLAKRFEVESLTKFENWPRFVECSQRRNLITHCGGVVSQQYVDICRNQGIKLAESVKLGERLTISEEYLLTSISLVTEVGVKLGQVLWRTFGAEAIKVADVQLGDLLFQLLKREEWTLALRLGEFGRECGNRKYPTPRRERSVKVITINHAQAAKWSGDEKTAHAIIDAADWSGSSIDFPFAVACIKGNWDEAATLMREIGLGSQLIPVHAYTWPVFREFRVQPIFSATFEEVFGVRFAEELKTEAEELPPRSQAQSEEKPDASGPNEEIVDDPPGDESPK